jgi:hypothetical protein
MSRNSRALRAARLAAKPVMKLKGPGEAATMIPYLLGFKPHDSLVVVDLEGPRKRFGPVLRIDLTDDPTNAPLLAAQVMRVLVSRDPARVLVAAFSDSAERAEPLVRLVLGGLASHGIDVEDALRVGDGRWWSYICTSSACCSPEGTPFEPDTSRVAAEAVLSGMSVAPDRDALRNLFAPASCQQRDQVRAAVAQLKRDDRSVLPPACVELMPERVATLLAKGADLSATEVAWLALAGQSIRGRDSALLLIERAVAEQHLDLWRTVMSLVDDDLLAPVGCLAAFSAWLEGRGVLASHALERVLAIDPDYSLAHCIEGLLTASIDPRAWPGFVARPTP